MSSGSVVNSSGPRTDRQLEMASTGNGEGVFHGALCLAGKAPNGPGPAATPIAPQLQRSCDSRECTEFTEFSRAFFTDGFATDLTASSNISSQFRHFVENCTAGAPIATADEIEVRSCLSALPTAVPAAAAAANEVEAVQRRENLTCFHILNTGTCLSLKIC
mmetsp:Transcript_38394/g.72040  ORF Transcript_38394/g.72040 Transcript_38394/m.72040 type:complete len:162 (+) Transcript_38394:583-1068(+)